MMQHNLLTAMLTAGVADGREQQLAAKLIDDRAVLLRTLERAQARILDTLEAADGQDWDEVRKTLNEIDITLARVKGEHK